jgi:hypothetical protein
MDNSAKKNARVKWLSILDMRETVSIHRKTFSVIKVCTQKWSFGSIPRNYFLLGGI